MRPIEDEILGVGLDLRQPFHQHRMNVEPLFLEFLGTDIRTPLQRRHALDQRVACRLRDDDVLDRGDEFQVADQARFILDELLDLIGREVPPASRAGRRTTVLKIRRSRGRRAHT